jgi:hypothetical protein
MTDSVIVKLISARIFNPCIQPEEMVRMRGDVR